MAFDPSIFNMANKPTTALKTPQEVQMEALALQEARNRGQLSSMQLRGAQQAQFDKELFRQRVAAGEDPAQVMRSMGNIEGVQKLAKGGFEADKAAREAQKAKIEALSAYTQRMASIAGTIADEPSYQAAKAQMAQEAQAFGLPLGPMHPSYDPAQVQMMMKRGMSVQQQLEQARMALEAEEVKGWHGGVDLSTGRPAVFGTRRGQLVKREGVAPIPPAAIQGSVGLQKPPSGFRYTADGNLEPIPGGPADRKIALEEEKRQNVAGSTRVTVETGRRLLNHPGLPGAIGAYGLNRFIPGSDSASFEAELEAFKAQNFIPQVQALRGMGQLSDAEGKKLTDAIGALSYKMKEEDFKASLKRIIDRLEELSNRPTVNPTSRSNAPAQSASRTVTMADVEATARSSGRTVDQVKAAMQAKGWVVR